MAYILIYISSFLFVFLFTRIITVNKYVLYPLSIVCTILVYECVIVIINGYIDPFVFIRWFFEFPFALTGVIISDLVFRCIYHKPISINDVFISSFIASLVTIVPLTGYLIYTGLSNETYPIESRFDLHVKDIAIDALREQPEKIDIAFAHIDVTFDREHQVYRVTFSQDGKLIAEVDVDKSGNHAKRVVVK